MKVPVPRQGNSMVEYALPLGILILGLLPFSSGILNVLSASLQDSLAIHEVRSGSMVLSPLGQATMQSTQLDSPLASNLVAMPGAKDITFKTIGGINIQLRNYPVDLPSVVETVGANGATEQLSMMLIQLADQMEASGEMTAENASALRNLANQGYRLAELERGVESLAQTTGTDLAAFSSGTFQFEGQTLSSDSVQHKIGFMTKVSVENSVEGFAGLLNTDLSAMQDGIAPETRTFIELFQKAQTGGALTDPSVNKLVNQLSGEILYISESVANASWLMIYEPSYFASNQSANLITSFAASKVTELNSSSICQAGGGVANGPRCL